MRKFLSINLLIACIALPSCSDGTANFVSSADGPDAPINDPDTGVFNPANPGSGNTTEPTNGGTTGSGANSGGTGEGGEPSDPGNGGGTTGGGSTGGGSSGAGNGGTGGGTNTGGGGGGGGGGGSSVGSEGGSSGQPVPEPGTLFLVGTGLAGVGASLLRRRRKNEQPA